MRSSLLSLAVRSIVDDSDIVGQLLVLGAGEGRDGSVERSAVGVRVNNELSRYSWGSVWWSLQHQGI